MKKYLYLSLFSLAIFAAVPAVSYAATLVSEWTFDTADMTSNVTDSVGSNTGDFITTYTGTTSVPGVFNQGLAFDGVGNLVETTNSIGNPTAYSEAVWFKARPGASGNFIVLNAQQNGQGGAWDRLLFMHTTGQVSFGVYNGGDDEVVSTNTYTDDKWHLAVGTNDGTNSTLYVDGVSQGSLSDGPGYTGYSSSYWVIGGGQTWDGSNGYFPGELDDARVYTGALSPTDVTALYDAGIPATTTSPCGFGNLVDGMCVGYLYTTSGSSWTVPSDWNSSDNTIQCIGAGGDGAAGSSVTSVGGAGGGGGAYAKIADLSLTTGNSIDMSVGAGGGAAFTYFNGSSGSSASLSCAPGGNASGTSAGAGGTTGASIGSLTYAGGSGGSTSGTSAGAGAGGGGSAGPVGAGESGGTTGSSVANAGSGGGGSDGGSSTAGGAATSESDPAAGGEGISGSGAGPAEVVGTCGNTPVPGILGGGGGGGGGGLGGDGGNDSSWDLTHGAGGGGGGGGQCYSTGYLGGNGGEYGGGGGGGSYGPSPSGSGGTGGDGLIVITYTPSSGGSTGPASVGAKDQFWGGVFKLLGGFLRIN